jgi:hypothetical protein
VYVSVAYSSARIKKFKPSLVTSVPREFVGMAVALNANESGEMM